MAAAEFAIVGTVMATLLAGVFQIGNAVHEMHLLQQALRAGGLYASSFPTQLGADISPSTNNNGILLAIQAALPANWTTNVNGDQNWTPIVALAAPVFSPPRPTSPTQPGTPPYFITLTATLADRWLETLGMNSASYVIRVQ